MIALPTAHRSETIADLLPCAGERFGARVAQRHLVGGRWRDVTFAEAAGTADEIARGLVDLGVEAGDRVAILCSTRVEWAWCSHAISAAAGVVVPIYATNSSRECAWVAGNSGSVAVVCEDADQVRKIEAVRPELPDLRHVIVIDPSGVGDAVADVVSLGELRRRGRAVTDDRVLARTAAVRPSDPYTFIYTSGTTGPPKGCVLTHGNYRAVMDMVNARAMIPAGEDDLVYLYLPLAHAFGLLLMLLSADLGVALAYWGGDPTRMFAELAHVRPTYLPSVPRIFEKLYALVTAGVDGDELARATRIGVEVRDALARGDSVPSGLQMAFDEADERLFSGVRTALGGRVREAITGAAPIAKDILEFFYACGVPVMEGYGMTETSTTATGMRPGRHRFGSVGSAHPGIELAIAGDGEVLIRGANIFQRYHGNDAATAEAIVDGWLHTGDLGRVDDDGFLFITGRKKDIIITAGGKNLTPANIENELRQSRWVSQAVMHGDRRPYPTMLITLDETEILPWAVEQGLGTTSVADLAEHPSVIALVQQLLDDANAGYAPVEQVKRFFILERDLSQETGELTPTLKVKRNVVNETFSARFDALYANESAESRGSTGG